MINTQEHLLEIIDGFYVAGFGDSNWENALQKLVEGFGAVGSNLFEIDLEIGGLMDWSDYGLAPQGGDYASHMYAVCPRVAHSWSRKTGEIFVDYDLITEHEMDRHEVYDWLNKTSDVRYFMGCRVSEHGSRTTGASLEFSASHGHVTPGEIATYNLIIPHIRNARQIRNSLQRENNNKNFATFMQASMPWGVVGLDRSGDILFVNPKAEETFRLNDGIKASNKRLAIWQSATGRSLDSLIAKAIKSSNGTALSAGGSLPVARPSGKPGFAVQVMPVAGNNTGSNTGSYKGNKSDLAALVYIFDPANGEMQKADHLATFYGLTKAETALAVALYNTCSLQKAADTLGIARNTARVQLNAIRTKTRTASQLELIKLLALLRPL